ncbi:MAG: hypothetical protein ACRCVZ_04260 [Aestuariivirga sp.]
MESDIKRKFGLVWPAHVGNLTRLLIAARQAFDGDLDMFLVLAIIGDRTFSARNADPALTFEAWQTGGAPHVATEDINIRSIADFSGIPRETVRRKLAQLIDKGWVVRGDNNALAATLKARNELAPLTEESLRYLIQMFHLFEGIAGEPPRVTG